LGRFVFGLTLVMTDVVGPVLPPERCSSLFERDADVVNAADCAGSGLEVGCDMVQAFDIPAGTWKEPSEALPPELSWLPRQFGCGSSCQQVNPGRSID
jgi:hypothetical protein